MLRKIRIALSSVLFFCLCLLFLDFTGTIHTYLGWMAKIQFIPAALALNLVVILLLAVLTLLFGRVYCSVICPLGIMQDIISWIRGKAAKKQRFRFHYRKALNYLRYAVLILFVGLGIGGLLSIASLVEPYSTFGRIMSNLFAPVYAACNNLLALICERLDSYAFYSTDVWIKSIPTFVAAIVTFVLLFVLAWRDGRIWCNSICPVGTLLGTISRYSLFAPVINKEKCTGCGLCGKGCKASCIDSKEHKIDLSRCVVCMDCIGNCSKAAIEYKFRYDRKAKSGTVVSEAVVETDNEKERDVTAVSEAVVETDNGKERDVTAVSEAVVETDNEKERDVTAKIERENCKDEGRRSFINGIAIAGGAALLGTVSEKVAIAQKTVDGGLAPLSPKQSPERSTPIVPAGSKSLKHFDHHCIACQLCVSVCPNRVLRPSLSADRFMLPQMGYENGYCRPECTKCSEVCPAGAIRKIDREEKAVTKIGTASVNYSLCVSALGEDVCGNCAKHCPAQAIMLVKSKDRDHKNKESQPHMIPVVDENKCIGCGACEYLCPARPLSAISVNGVGVHHQAI